MGINAVIQVKNKTFRSKLMVTKRICCTLRVKTTDPQLPWTNQKWWYIFVPDLTFRITHHWGFVWLLRVQTRYPNVPLIEVTWYPLLILNTKQKQQTMKHPKCMPCLSYFKLCKLKATKIYRNLLYLICFTTGIFFNTDDFFKCVNQVWHAKTKILIKLKSK